MGNFSFFSIHVENYEDPQTGAFSMKFDAESVKEHTIEISFRDIVKNRAWVISCFISIMCNTAVFGLVYAAAALGLGLEFSSPESASFRIIFFSGMVFSFLIFWSVFAVPGAVKNIKHDTVINERGTGPWKIVDQKKWPAFKRLLELSEKNRENRPGGLKNA